MPRPSWFRPSHRTTWLVVLAVGLALSAVEADAQCPYSSVQIRVQINTSTHWNTSTIAALDKPIHIGVFKNGWGVPIDQGGVTVFAIQGAFNQVLPLSGWETWWKPGQAVTNDRWTFEVYCGGTFRDRAEATWGTNLDVLPYILPNYPGSTLGSPNTVVTDKTNNWRTYSTGGNMNERLPGFFITKGGIDWTWTMQPGFQTIHWNFEQMIYDGAWIYLVRDTSWDRLCTDNWHLAGQLVLTYENGQWLRGGRHFPRTIVNGGTRDTGWKYIQGVQRAEHHADTAGEGRWCPAQNSGWAASTIYGEWIGRQTVGDRTFGDVLKLRTAGGAGAGDEWWFARGPGLIRFTDGSQSERHETTAFNYPVTVRIPCYPNAPCH